MEVTGFVARSIHAGIRIDNSISKFSPHSTRTAPLCTKEISPPAIAHRIALKNLESSLQISKSDD